MKSRDRRRLSSRHRACEFRELDSRREATQPNKFRPGTHSLSLLFRRAKKTTIGGGWPMIEEILCALFPLPKRALDREALTHDSWSCFSPSSSPFPPPFLLCLCVVVRFSVADAPDVSSLISPPIDYCVGFCGNSPRAHFHVLVRNDQRRCLFARTHQVSCVYLISSRLATYRM